MASLVEFKQSTLGQQVGAIISNQDNVIRMIALSESGIPAVQAIGRRLIPLMPRDEDLTEIKKIIGRWVKEILEPVGWTPVGKGRVAPGNLFSAGTIFGPRESSAAIRIADPDLEETKEDDVAFETREEDGLVSDEPEERTYTWSNRERQRLIAIRNCLFKDPGGGVFRNVPREFVLHKPADNIWAGIRADAIEYFARNSIQWWGGSSEPTGHMLSSQVACVNHLYLLRQRRDLATAVLRGIDPEVDQAEVVDDGYVEFEFIGKHQYLKEAQFSRGANCTSVDAFMIGLLKRGERRAYLIEWKYTEVYQQVDKYISKRKVIYDDLIKKVCSPFKHHVEARAFYFEPFYQLMRQTLLGWQMTSQKDQDHYRCTSYRHVHVVPNQNLEFLQNVTSPNLTGASVSDAWRAVLKIRELYIDTTPPEFMQPILDQRDTKALTVYLEQRYWAGI